MNLSYIMGGGSLGFLQFQKCVILALKRDFFGKKDKKITKSFLKKNIVNT